MSARRTLFDLIASISSAHPLRLVSGACTYEYSTSALGYTVLVQYEYITPKRTQNSNRPRSSSVHEYQCCASIESSRLFHKFTDHQRPHPHPPSRYSILYQEATRFEDAILPTQIHASVSHPFRHLSSATRWPSFPAPRTTLSAVPHILKDLCPHINKTKIP